MHFSAQFFQPFLMGNAEMLLLVNHHQTKPVKGDILRQKRMCANHNIDLPIGQTGFGIGCLFAADKAGQFANLHWQTGKAVFEGLAVLSCQQGCRGNHRHLLTRHGGNKGSTQGDFGFAETDIAANQPVHWPAARQIIHYRRNGIKLVVGFLVRKAAAKPIINGRLRQHFLALSHGARRRGFNQLLGNQFQLFFQPAFTDLPSRATQPVERDRHIIAAKAAQQVNVFNRQKKARITVINKFQTIMRRAAHINRLQALKPANAMFDMHHMVALAEAGGFGQEVFRPFTVARTHHAVAKNILLGDDGQILRYKPVLKPNCCYGATGWWQRLNILPTCNLLCDIQPMIAQQTGQSLG